MKRLIAGVVAIMLSVLCYNPNIFADDTKEAVFENDIFEKYKDAVETLVDIKILSSECASAEWANKEFSRVELAKIALKMYGFADAARTTEWASGFLGDASGEYVETNTETRGEVSPFKDVPVDYEDYYYVKSITEYGLMSGGSDGNFAPEHPATFEQIAKVMLSIMGFKEYVEQNGGYPGGYISIAVRNNIFSGVKYKAETPVLCGEAAQIIYNFLYMEMLQPRHYRVDGHVYYSFDHEDVTLLEFLGMKYVDGILTGNGLTSVNGKSPSKNTVEIDGNVYNTKLFSEGIACIGRYVRAIYKDDDMREVVSLRPVRNDITYIDADDIEKFSDHTLRYYVNNKIHTIKIDNLCKVILNGVYMPGYTDEVFDISEGGVYIIRHNSKVAYVEIQSFRSSIVRSVNPIGNEVYTELATPFKIDTNEYGVRVFDSSGNAIPFDSISKDGVISVAENGNIATAYMSFEKVSGIAEMISGDTMRIQGKKYKVSKEFAKDARLNSFKPGDRVEVYLSYFGKIVWCEKKAADTGYKSAYMVKVAYIQPFGPVKIKVFNTNGKFETLEFADKVQVYYENNRGQEVRGNYRAEEAYRIIDNYENGYIRYCVGEENKVSGVEIPLSKMPENRTSRSYSIVNFRNNTDDDNLFYFHSNTKSFSHRVYIGGNTVVMGIPENDIYNENKYKILNENSFNSLEAYPISAFTSDFGSLTADVILKYTDTENNDAFTNYNANTKIAVVLDVVDEIDEFGENIKTLVYSVNGVEEKMFAYYNKTDASGKECTVFDLAPNPSNSEEIALEKGDMFLFVKKENGETERVTVVFDADRETDFGVLGAIPGQSSQYLYPSSLIRESSYIIKNNAGLANGNPFHIQGLTSTGGALKIYQGGCRIGLYYVNKNYNGNIYLTTQDIVNTQYSAGGIPKVREECDGTYAGNVEKHEGVYVQDCFDFNKFNTKLLVEYYPNDKVVARAATVDDIRAYADAGNSCSRVMTMNVDVYSRDIVIINDYR